VFLFTDGVTEALSKSREFYTSRRLLVVLRDVYALPVQRITRAVVQDVRNFVGDQPQADDISVLALRWVGPVEFSEPALETVRGTETLSRPY
jgi:sigma-B regulation protein RsbU (phosphoserine phosphatase)